MDASSEKFEDLTAVFNRIKFQRVMLQSLILLYPSKSIAPNEMEMTEISKLLTSAAELMPAIKKTVQRGTQPNADRELNCEPSKYVLTKKNFQIQTRWASRQWSISVCCHLPFPATQKSKIEWRHSVIWKNFRTISSWLAKSLTAPTTKVLSTFSWSSARNQVHVCCHAASCKCFTFQAITKSTELPV